MSRPLASLSVEEVAVWLRSVNLAAFAESFPGRHIDGSELVEIEELDEVLEEFADCGGSRLKLKKLFKLIVTAKAGGVEAAVFAPAAVVCEAAPAPAPEAPAVPAAAPTPPDEKADSPQPPAVDCEAAPAPAPEAPAVHAAAPTPPDEKADKHAPTVAAPALALETKDDTFPDAPLGGSPPSRYPAEPPGRNNASPRDVVAPPPPPGAKRKVGPPPGKKKPRKSRAARPSLVNAQPMSPPSRGPSGRGPMPPTARQASKAANRPKRRTMGGGNQFDVVSVKIFGAKLVEAGRKKFHVYHIKVSLRNRSEYLLQRQFAHFKSMYKEYCADVGELPLFEFPKSKRAGKRFTDRTVAKRIFALQCMMTKIIKQFVTRKRALPMCIGNFLGLTDLEKNLEKTAMRKAKRQSLIGNMEHEFILSNDFRKKRLGAEIEADKTSGRVFVVHTTADSGGKLRVGDELVSIESEPVLGMVIDRVRATLSKKARENGVVSMRFKRSGGGGGAAAKKKAIMSADAAWGDVPVEPSARLGGDGTDGLPVGWELMNVTHKGAERPLYINHSKRHTQWEPPSMENFAADLDGADLEVSEKDVKCDIKLTAEDEVAFNAGGEGADSDDADDGASDEETVAEEEYMMPSARDADEILIAGDSSAAAAMALAGGAQADGIGDRNAAFFRAQKAAKADMAVRPPLFHAFVARCIRTSAVHATQPCPSPPEHGLRLSRARAGGG